MSLTTQMNLADRHLISRVLKRYGPGVADAVAVHSGIFDGALEAAIADAQRRAEEEEQQQEPERWDGLS